MASNKQHFVLVKYLECMHNHAANSMGYVLDGCGEFCPSGPPGTPESFICAACQCHRNFHRKVEVEEQVVDADLELSNFTTVYHPTHGGPLIIIDSPPRQYSTKPRQIDPHPHEMFDNNNVEMTMEEEEEDEDEEEIEVSDQSNFKRKGNASSSSSSGRRMKLDAYQKERIWAFADQVMGWKWSKDNEEVIPFCDDIGITPQFLKNWINNNRRRLGPFSQNI